MSITRIIMQPIARASKSQTPAVDCVCSPDIYLAWANEETIFDGYLPQAIDEGFQEGELPRTYTDYPRDNDSIVRTVDFYNTPFGVVVWLTNARLIGDACGQIIVWRYEFTPLETGPSTIPTIIAHGGQLTIGIQASATGSSSSADPVPARSIDPGVWQFWAQVCGVEFGPITLTIVKDVTGGCCGCGGGCC